MDTPTLAPAAVEAPPDVEAADEAEEAEEADFDAESAAELPPVESELLPQPAIIPDTMATVRNILIAFFFIDFPPFTG